MKQSILLSLLYISFISPPTFAQDGKTVIGLGTGKINSGLGVGAGRVFDDAMIYGSTGCYGWSSSRGWVCALGLSYLHSLPWGKVRKHAVQFGYNFVRERKGLGFDDEYRKKDTWVNRPTLGYLYFFDGMDDESGHIGFNLSEESITFNWGYQWVVE